MQSTSNLINPKCTRLDGHTFIEVTGFVSPCCWLITDTDRVRLLKDLFGDDFDKLFITKSSMSDIKKIYKKLYDTWETDNPFPTCLLTCNEPINVTHHEDTEIRAVKSVFPSEDTMNTLNGTQTPPDGDEYVGVVKDGKYDGQGTMTFSDRTKYVGEFNSGKKHGQGTFIDTDGTIYEREWVNGKEKNA